MRGAIFLISGEAQRCARVSRWILEWVERSGADVERSVYLMDSIELARVSLAEPLRIGDPPALVILDRATSKDPSFAELVSDCIPECWVVEILEEQDLVPLRGGIVGIRSNARRDEWESTLHHCLQECPSPQWSRVED